MPSTAKLSELASIQSGIFAKPDPVGEVYYIQSRHFDNDHEFDYSTKPELAPKPNYSKHFLTEGDIVIASKGNHFYAVEYKGIIKPAVASTTFMVIRLKDKEATLPSFITWQLNTTPVQEKLNNSAKGTAIPSLTKGALAELELHIPDTLSQHQIVRLNSLKKQRNKILGQLNALYDKKIELQLINSVNK